MTEHTKKLVSIIVNGEPYNVEKEDISYAEVVTMAFPDYPKHPEVLYSVKYKRGQGDKPEGILPLGGTVKVKEGMIFNVEPTGQS